MARQELFVTWLNDAHALENAVAGALRDQAKLAEDHPEVKSAIEQHLQATERHMTVVEECLELVGESSSGLKDTMAKMGGKMQSMMQGGSGHTLLMAALNDYSAEHMEIASYESLIVAANELGHTEIASKLQTVLDDEKRMAAWLQEQIPLLTRHELMNAHD